MNQIQTLTKSAQSVQEALARKGLNCKVPLSSMAHGMLGLTLVWSVV